MILRRFYTLDVLPGGFPLIIRASQNDSSSELVFSLYTGFGLLDIPSGATASVRRGSLENSCTLVQSGGLTQVTVRLTKAMTACVGLIPFELVITSGGYTLVTATFYLDVR